jgi:integration host factor subunit alpha
MSLTKADIINSICKNCGCSKKKSSELMEGVFRTIKKTLESGEDVLISSFGKFCIKEKNDRRGRNPGFNNDLNLETRRTVTFKCSPVMEKKIN